MTALTESLEDYLETIYILQQNSEDVRITDIARTMSISKPSVNRAVNSLKLENLLIHERYGRIKLTQSGKIAAEEVYSRHKILRDFFVKILKIDPITAEIDACRAEHVLSKESIEQICKYSSNL